MDIVETNPVFQHLLDNLGKSNVRVGTGRPISTRQDSIPICDHGLEALLKKPLEQEVEEEVPINKAENLEISIVDGECIGFTALDYVLSRKASDRIRRWAVVMNGETLKIYGTHGSGPGRKEEIQALVHAHLMTKYGAQVRVMKVATLRQLAEFFDIGTRDEETGKLVLKKELLAKIEAYKMKTI